MDIPIPLDPEYQEQLLAVVPKFSAAVGLPSNLLLIREVVLAHMLKSQKQPQKQPQEQQEQQQQPPPTQEPTVPPLPPLPPLPEDDDDDETNNNNTDTTTTPDDENGLNNTSNHVRFAPTPTTVTPTTPEVPPEAPPSPPRQRPKRKRGGNPILRSLAFVAFFLTLDALGWFLSTWAVPEGDFAYSSGTQQSCDFQGFMLQVVIGAPLFSCAMAWYFWLIVCRNKSSEQLLVYERWVSPLIVLYAFGSSFFLWSLGMFNHIGAVCWVQGSPPGCGNSSYQGNPDEPCDRGDWAWVYGMAMFYIPVWICIVFIIFFNISNYFRLRTTGHEEDASWFAAQSFLYALAFVVTWAPSTTWSGLQWKVDGGSFIVDILAAIFEPLGGFWNLLIFLRARPASRRRVLRLVCCECFEQTDCEEEDKLEEIDVDGPPDDPSLRNHSQLGESSYGVAPMRMRAYNRFKNSVTRNHSRR